MVLLTKSQASSTTERVSLADAKDIDFGTAERAPPTLPSTPRWIDDEEQPKPDDDPGSGTMEPVGFDPSAPTDEEASAPDQGEEFSEVDITLRAVQPEELGFASVDEMHRAVRAGLGIDDDRPIHVGHDKKDGKAVITVSVSPR